MSGQSETTQLVETVAGLERVMGQVAVILQQHGQMLRELLEAAAVRPKEESGLDELVLALIGRMDRQAGLLERMEARFGQVGESVAAMAQGFSKSRDQAP